MAKGKYEKVLPRKQNRKAVLLLCLVLLLSVTVVGTLAYVIASTGSLQNLFVPSNIICTVDENGLVTNEGNVDAYIRAAVVVNWMDEAGNVYGIRPNYTLTINNGWQEIGGFYYYTVPVASNAKTQTAPVTVSVNGSAPASDYSLSIEVVAEAIQAQGVDGNQTAVEKAWGVTYPLSGG